MNDGQLLSHYLQNRDEAAFAALLARHLGLVRGVVTQRLARSQAAEDAVMRVFTQLARKAASLQRRSSLGGWLVVAARQEALLTARTEARRSQAMERFASEGSNTISNPPPSESAWRDAEPRLYEALESLSEKDREAVMLRFYEEQPYQEIGALIGASAEAARKRVGKALGQLEQYFRRRGIVWAAGILAAQLTSHFQAQAQAGLNHGAAAAEISHRALSAAAVKSSAAMLAAGLVPPVLLVLSSYGGGWLAGKNTSEHRPAPLLAESAVPKPPASPATAARPVNALSLREIALEMIARYERSEPTEPILDAVEPGSLPDLMRLLSREFDKRYNTGARVASQVLDRWSQVDAAAASEFCLREWKDGRCELWTARGNLTATLRCWAKADPAAAVAWLKAQAFPPATHRGLYQTLLAGMAESSPALAVRSLAELPWDQRRFAIADTVKAIAESPRAGDREIFLQELARLPGETLRAELFLGFLQDPAAPKISPADAAAQFQRLQLTDEDEAWPILNELAGEWWGHEETRAQAASFLWDKAAPEARPLICASYLRHWADGSSPAISSWMQARGLTQETILQMAKTLEVPR